MKGFPNTLALSFWSTSQCQETRATRAKALNKTSCCELIKNCLRFSFAPLALPRKKALANPFGWKGKRWVKQDPPSPHKVASFLHLRGTERFLAYHSHLWHEISSRTWQLNNTLVTPAIYNTYSTNFKPRAHSVFRKAADFEIYGRSHGPKEGNLKSSHLSGRLSGINAVPYGWAEAL